MAIVTYVTDSIVVQVCGDVSVWKPSDTTPLIAVAVTKIVESVLVKNNIPGAVASLCVGGKDIGQQLVKDPRMKLVSFTGSTAVGQQVSRLFTNFKRNQNSQLYLYIFIQEMSFLLLLTVPLLKSLYRQNLQVIKGI